MQSIKRVLKMHNSTVVILPTPICRELGIRRREYVLIETVPGERAARISPIKIPPGEPNGSPPHPD